MPLLSTPCLFQSLLKEMEKGHSLLKSAREKGERALCYLELEEAETLRKEIHDDVEQLKELTTAVRKEHVSLERGLLLAKEFSDKCKAMTQWMTEYQESLLSPEEPKMELYEKKAQLSKYKVILDTCQQKQVEGCTGRGVSPGVCH